jgi:hypothetical protein
MLSLPNVRQFVNECVPLLWELGHTEIAVASVNHVLAIVTANVEQKGRRHRRWHCELAVSAPEPIADQDFLVRDTVLEDAPGNLLLAFTQMSYVFHWSHQSSLRLPIAFAGMTLLRGPYLHLRGACEWLNSRIGVARKRL